MPDWSDLDRELDRWAAEGRAASFWWRDDDATRATPSLDRLLALRNEAKAPLAIAVIPGRAEPALALRLARETDIAVLQHGWLHLNHAPPGAPKAELGAHRPAAFILGELARGRLAMDRLFGRAWLDVLVPPHNRIAREVASGLPLAGYSGLSTYDARGTAIRGLVQVNAHIDIMDWTTRAFVGVEIALALALRHLGARRAGSIDADEPTGLLTHHLAHDGPAWDFTTAFLSRVAAHPAARWSAAPALFQPTGADRA